MRADSFVNAIAGFGTSRDKRTSTTFEVEPVTDLEARDLWRGNDIVKRAIEKPVEEAFRAGFVLKFGDDEELAKRVTTRLEELLAVPKMVRAGMYERAYGGAALFPVINDGAKDLAEPLDEKRIARVSAIHALEPRQLTPVKWYDDLMSTKYGEPMTYRFESLTVGRRANVIGQEIHESRLVIFPGIRVSDDQTSSTALGWGDNVITPAKQVIADFDISWSAAAALMYEFAQGVLKLSGLAQMLAQDEGKLVRDRLVIMDVAKSVLRSMVIDKDDDFKREQTPIAGMPDMLREFAFRVAAALDMPVSLVMGMAPGGMNATGEFDMRSWYDRVSNRQSTHYGPRLERLIKLAVLLAKDGPTKGREPEQWSIEWKPLWQPTAKEIAETEKVIAETDHIRIEDQVLTNDECRGRYRGDKFGTSIVVQGEIDLPEPSEEHVALLEAQRAKLAGGKAPAPKDELAEKRRAAIEAALAEEDEPAVVEEVA